MLTFLTVCGMLTASFLAWRFWFFMRNPARQVPAQEGLLAPADGFVVYLQRVEAGTVPMAVKKGQTISLEELNHYPQLANASGYLIGIFMTAFSVHHNRVPLTGKVVFKHWVKTPNNLSTARLMANLLIGKRPYAENCEHLIVNERVTLGIQTPRGTYSLTQIADKWISHIVNPVEIGQDLTRGERFGMIRFGSQVDVFVPDELGLQPTCKAGEYVLAGERILATSGEPKERFKQRALWIGFQKNCTVGQYRFI